MKTHRLLILPLVAAVLVVGCGGDDDPALSASTPAATASVDAPAAAPPAATNTPTPAATAPPVDSSDEQLAQSAQFVKADFPSDWTESPAGDESNLTGCEAITSARAATSGRATSPTFTAGATTLAQSFVYVFKDEAAAQAAFDGITSEETRQCLGVDLAKNIGGDAGAPAVEEIAVEALGDGSGASRVSIPLQGGAVNLVADVVFIRTARGVALTTFANADMPFDEGQRAELLAKLADRLTTALG